jgi:very-short-patch-repair endonuclease
MKVFPQHSDPVLACVELARTQDRLLARYQVMDIGLSPRALERLVARGQWTRVLPRVYSTDGRLDGWWPHVRASALWAGTDSAISHGSAGCIWGLPITRPSHIDVTSQRRLRPPASWVKTHRSDFLLPMDVRTHEGLVVTDPTRTIFDLASVLDKAGLEQCLEWAIDKGLTSRARLRWRIRQQDADRRRGMGSLRALLVKQPLVTTESPLELRFEQILREAKLPPPVRQFRVLDEDGRFVARLDFAYPEAKIAIEVDGYRHHSDSHRGSWFHDRERRNKVVLLGWRPLHFTSELIYYDPAKVVARVKKLRGDSLF